MIEVTCVGYHPLLVWTQSDNYNQRVPKPLVLVKVVGKGRIKTWRVDVLNLLISPIDLPEVVLVVRAMDIVTPHLGRRENGLLVSNRKRNHGLRLSRNCLWQNFSKG